MISNNIEELEKVKKECEKLISKRSYLSAMVAVVPLPFLDVGADVLILINMLDKINKKFGLDPKQIDELDSSVKKELFVIISSIGSQFVGKVIKKEIIIQVLKKIGIRITTKQATKYVPLLGQAFSASISFGAMKYVGKSHINDCYNIVLELIKKNNH